MKCFAVNLIGCFIFQFIFRLIHGFVATGDTQQLHVVTTFQDTLKRQLKPRKMELILVVYFGMVNKHLNMHLNILVQGPSTLTVFFFWLLEPQDAVIELVIWDSINHKT